MGRLGTWISLPAHCHAYTHICVFMHFLSVFCLFVFLFLFRDLISIALVWLHAPTFHMLGDCFAGSYTGTVIAVSPCTCRITAGNGYLVTKRWRPLVRPSNVIMRPAKEESKMLFFFTSLRHPPEPQLRIWLPSPLKGRYWYYRHKALSWNMSIYMIWMAEARWQKCPLHLSRVAMETHIYRQM